VQVIDLELHDRVDVRLDLVRGEEVPGHVEHHAAVLEPRPVHDPPARNRDVTGAGDRHELPQRLHGREQTGLGVRPHRDQVRADIQQVRLRPAVDLVEQQGDGARRTAHRHRIAGRRPQHRGEERPHRGGDRTDRRTRIDREVSGRIRPHVGRDGNDVA
jgi:hypothetical protein